MLVTRIVVGRLPGALHGACFWGLVAVVILNLQRIQMFVVRTAGCCNNFCDTFRPALPETVRWRFYGPSQ